MKFNFLGKENQNALDNFRDSNGLVASRPCHFVHDGRVHPYFAGFGDRRHADQGHSGPKTDLVPFQRPFSNFGGMK
jgi:hypothetical protein